MLMVFLSLCLIPFPGTEDEEKQEERLSHVFGKPTSDEWLAAGLTKCQEAQPLPMMINFPSHLCFQRAVQPFSSLPR